MCDGSGPFIKAIDSIRARRRVKIGNAFLFITHYKNAKKHFLSINEIKSNMVITNSKKLWTRRTMKFSSSEFWSFAEIKEKLDELLLLLFLKSTAGGSGLIMWWTVCWINIRYRATAKTDHYNKCEVKDRNTLIRNGNKARWFGR